MNDAYIVTTFVVIDDLLKAYDYQEDCRAQSSAAEILRVAVVAARYFQNHHERALCPMSQFCSVRRLSVSRFNRGLHAVRDWLCGLVTVLGEVFAQGEVFLIDRMPLPVCKRVRAQRCRTKCEAAAPCGYCAARRERFFSAGDCI